MYLLYPLKIKPVTTTLFDGPLLIIISVFMRLFNDAISSETWDYNYWSKENNS